MALLWHLIGSFGGRIAYVSDIISVAFVYYFLKHILCFLVKNFTGGFITSIIGENRFPPTVFLEQPQVEH
jgi:hypothetical protein